MTRHHRTDRFVWTYQSIPEPTFGIEEELGAAAIGETDIERYEYEGIVGESKAIIERIRDEIDARYEESRGREPGVIVVGVKDYLAADAWVRYDTNDDESLADVITWDIVTVPGRMIHAPKAPEVAVIDHMKEVADDGT
jgi:hypothetical protein